MGTAKDRTADEIRIELKQMLVNGLNLHGLKAEQIGDDEPLFGEGGLGLDSLDGVEVVVLLQRQYGLDVKEMQKSREIFRSINTLVPYVLQHAVK